METLLDLIKRGIERKPRKILHIGANRGGEAMQYSKGGVIGYHVEAIPDIFAILQKNCARLNQQFPVQACLHFDHRTLEFNIASNFASSSVLQLGRHAVAYPEITYDRRISVQTETIDSLVAEAVLPGDFDFAVLDVQGAELNVLKGGTVFLSRLDLLGLVIEVSSDPLYAGGATYLELCNFLEPFGFYTKQVAFNEDGWADALFVRRYWKLADDDIPPLYRDFQPPTTGCNIAVTGQCSQSSAHDLPGSDQSNRAVQGERGSGYAFHTRQEDRAWWMVDLQTPRRFDEILVFNRIDAGRTRANFIEIQASDTGLNWRTLWSNEFVFGGVDGRPLRVNCADQVARYVRILGSPNDYLHLNKVEIYDHNLATLDP